jgi:hypothetical protein
MTNLSELHLNARRTRRNVVKAGPILASAVALSLATSLATTKNALAGGGNDQGQNNNNQGYSHCLLKGTKVQTAEGERQIETLAVGDLLPTMFGGLRRIQWIARYPLKKSDPSKPWVKGVLPVRISRSALAPDVPRTDLYLHQGAPWPWTAPWRAKQVHWRTEGGHPRGRQWIQPTGRGGLRPRPVA